MEPFTTAAQMSSALAAREISSVELLQSAFDRIDAQDAELHAFVSLLDREELIGAAADIDRGRARGDAMHALAGIPIAVKDNIAVAKHRLTCGSRMLEHYVTPFSATAITRLQAAGLLVIGKTNMDEFGFGSSTENSAFFPTRNPHALDRVPGGTSGGSAAAVAVGMVPLALGTDTGGSVRQPASLCGVVGIRPSYGLVSRYGLVPYASSMDQIGTLAHTVDDAASLLQLIAGHDPMDSTSQPTPAPAFDEESRSLRLGIPDEYLSDDCEDSVLRAVDDVAHRAEAMGWSVRRVSLPLTKHALSAYYIVASVEAASNLARYDGVKYGFRVNGARSYDEMVTRTRTEGFGAEAKRRILLGTFTSSAGYTDQYYKRATDVRKLLAAEFAATFQDVDVLLSPVSPTTAWPLGERVTDPIRMYLSDVYSVPAALAQLPAVVIPTGHDPRGLPVGVQLTGPRLADALVIGAARALERALSR